MKNKSLIIICGDPESTFNEILIKTLKKNKILRKLNFPIIIICSKKLFKNELKNLKTKLNFQDFNNHNSSLKNEIYLIDIPLDYKKLSLAKKNKYINKSFEAGLNLLKKNNSSTLINGPISKATFLKGKYNGITEFLAIKTKSSNEVMLIFNKELSVSPITTHVHINKVTEKIKKKLIINKIQNISEFYKKFLGFRPNIAITGLNPHCETFEGKNIEKKEILPAIKFLKKKKNKSFRPFFGGYNFFK